MSVPAGLVPDTYAGRLYDALGPLANQDPANAWALLILCNTLGVMFQEVEDLVRDTPDGPGWSELMDLNRCPPEALDWLGQFVGVRIPNGLSDANRRAWVGSTDGFKRGTPAAMIGACKATLTGTQTVLFHERYGGGTTPPDYAYYLTIWTLTSETPDTAKTLAALTKQKPAGLVLAYSTTAVQTYATVKASYATYAVVKSTFSTYDALKASKPG